MKLNTGVLLGALVVSFALSFSAMAAEDAVPIIKDQNGCIAINPHPQPNETVTWNGLCKDGFMDGQGTVTWFESGKMTALYEGNMTYGLADGKGKLTWPNGASYTGDWKGSVQEGFGRLDGLNGSYYEGQWKNGVPNGQGKMQNEEGENFEGQFVNGEIVDTNDDKMPEK